MEGLPCVRVLGVPNNVWQSWNSTIKLKPTKGDCTCRQSKALCRHRWWSTLIWAEPYPKFMACRFTYSLAVPAKPPQTGLGSLVWDSGGRRKQHYRDHRTDFKVRVTQESKVISGACSSVLPGCWLFMLSCQGGWTFDGTKFGSHPRRPGCLSAFPNINVRFSRGDTYRELANFLYPGRTLAEGICGDFTSHCGKQSKDSENSFST